MCMIDDMSLKRRLFADHASVGTNGKYNVEVVSSYTSSNTIYSFMPFLEETTF